MSVYDSVHQSTACQDGTGNVLRNEDWSLFPNVCELIEGRKQEGADDYRDLPCTLMVFLDSSTLKFCFSQKKGSLLIFGEVERLSGAFTVIEEALSTGRYENKTRKVAKRS
jgi:hypothetical protein